MDGHIIQANVALCRMLGYSEQELLALQWLDLTDPEDLEASRDHFRDLFQGPGTSLEAERRLRHRNGAVVWMRMHLQAIREGAGNPLCALIHLEDITERKRKDVALRESEDRFRLLADSCPSMLWVTDGQGQNEFINRKYRDFRGASSEDDERAKWQLMVHPDDAAEYIRDFQRAVRGHEPLHSEVRFRRADGDWRWVGLRRAALCAQW